MPEINPLLIFFASIFTSNILLSNFLGMCSYVAISKNLKASVGLGIAVTFVSTSTSVINWLIYEYLLKPTQINLGMDLTFLQFIIFIIVIAAFVQLVEMFLEKTSPFLYNVLGIFLPLITTNCAVMGACLLNISNELPFFKALITSFSYAVGFGAAPGADPRWSTRPARRRRGRGTSQRRSSCCMCSSGSERHALSAPSWPGWSPRGASRSGSRPAAS